MNIAKALKTKNRFAGELGTLQLTFSRENSRKSDSTSTINCAELRFKIASARDKLINIKAAITKASAGIALELATLSEIKSSIAFYNGLNTKDGTEQECSYGQTVPITTTYIAHLKQEDVDGIIADLQQRANEIQDTIDDYNATTQVDFIE